MDPGSFGAPRRYEQPGGRVVVTTLAPKVAHFVVEGALDDVLAKAITHEGSLLIVDGDGVALHDWSGLKSYSSTARTICTDWMLKHREGFATVHILVNSSLVAMGVNVANLALGGFLHASTDAAAFARVLEDHRR